MSEPPLDESALLQLVDGDRAFLRTLVETFRADCRASMDALRTAVAAEDPDAIEQAAHQLKGAAGNLRAGPTREAARRLERMGAEGNLAEVADALAVLEREVDRLDAALRELTARDAS